MADVDRSILAVGRFRLFPARKLLMEDSEDVQLGSRALDVLIALVERARNIVTTDELAALVWPNSVVEASSIRVHVAAVRKALADGTAGARFVINAPVRGYSFAATVQKLSEDDLAEEFTDINSLARACSRIVGSPVRPDIARQQTTCAADIQPGYQGVLMHVDRLLLSILSETLGRWHAKSDGWSDRSASPCTHVPGHS